MNKVFFDTCIKCSKRGGFYCHNDGNYPIICLECLIKNHPDNNPEYVSCEDILDEYLKVVEENKRLLQIIKYMPGGEIYNKCQEIVNQKV